MNTLSPSLAADRPASRALRQLDPGRIVAAIRSFLLLLGLEIRRSQGYWLLPVMVAMGVYTPWIDHLPEVVIWPQMSHATLQSYVIVGPLAAALAAWLVDRDRRRRMRGFVDSFPGSGLQRDLLALGAASFWGLAGYALVLAWFGGQAVLWATWGGPDLGLVGTGVLAVVVFTAVGVLVGRLVPNKFSPLLALAATFFLSVATESFQTTFPDGGDRNPIQLLMPYGLTSVSYPNVFYSENDAFTGMVALWMLALLAVAIAAIAVVRSRVFLTVLALAGTIGLAGLAAMPLVAPDLAYGPLVWRTIAYTPICQKQGGFEICLHPAYETELDETAEQVSSTFGPVRGLEGVPTRWEQSNPALGGGSEAPGRIEQVGYEYGMLGSVSGIFPIVESGQHPQRPASQIVIMEWLVGQSNLDVPGWGAGWFGWPSEVPVTVQEYGTGMTGVGPDESALAAFQPRMDAVRERFAALSEAEQRAWLEASWHALRAGELALDDLP